jgi:NADH-quinone oxidoreductase subunit N
LKRLLAYSTIAHAGYMMMALTALNPQGVQAILFYLGAYFLMNLGAFAVIALLRNRTGSEELESYRGAIHQYPILVITLAIFLLSLLGIPPLIGFAAKFQVFTILYDSGLRFADSSPWLSYTLIGLLILAGINTVVSAGYYLKVLRVMILDNPPESPKSLLAGTNDFPKHGFLALLAGLVILGGIIWNPLTSASEKGISEFDKLPSTRLSNTP